MNVVVEDMGIIPPGIQVAQCRLYLQTLGSNVGIICVLGSFWFRGWHNSSCDRKVCMEIGVGSVWVRELWPSYG